MEKKAIEIRLANTVIYTQKRYTFLNKIAERLHNERRRIVLKNIKLIIDERPCIVPEGTTILEAADTIKNYIPTLFYQKGVVDKDDSGICVVQVAGEDDLVIASDRVVEEGMKVTTVTPEIMESRVGTLHQILAKHNKDCRNCFRTGNCELQSLLREYHVFGERSEEIKESDVDSSSPYIFRDSSKCIRCGRCVAMCQKVQGVNAIEMQGEVPNNRVVATSACGLGETNCVNCGQCIAVCPVGALYENDDTEEVFSALENPDKVVVAQIAPAVRAAMGEEFEFPVGIDVEGRVAAALRAMKFDIVFDTKFGADLTIIEEANELLERVEEGKALPMFTSCCPAWVKYCEQYYPEMLPHVSSCKSPHMMLGAVVKKYYAKELHKNQEDIVVVSIMPCTAKKFEINREEMDGVDYVLTTREFAKMLKKKQIDFQGLQAENFDEPLGIGTGAGVIFGATGGVMEAALRTAVEKITGKQLEALEFVEVRGTKGIKEAVVSVEGKEIKVAVVSGLENAKKVLEDIKAGKADYQFVEVMACPGGCVNGGGQPQQPARVQIRRELKSYRAKALYTNDENSVIRKSHENPSVIKLYEEYLEKPGSEKAHELLHTTYVQRDLK